MGMHENAILGRVMSLRDFLETKPKNISFSEDNGFLLPSGTRLDIKIYPRDSAVHVDRRHGWSRKWSWALWQVPNMPGMHWEAIETRVQAGHMYIFPAEARPILLASYVCSTDWYKGAQHACSIDQVQTGRKHLSGALNTCPTCLNVARTPPRETGRTRNSDVPVTCPTSESTNHIWAGPTELLYISDNYQQSQHALCTGTSAAPSRRPPRASTLPASWHNHSTRATAWDKLPRLGEAKNLGLEPPRELYLNRRNGQRDPIRLCTQMGDGFGTFTMLPHSEWQRGLPPMKLGKSALSPSPYDAAAACLPGSSVDLLNPCPHQIALALPGRNLRLTVRYQMTLSGRNLRPTTRWRMNPADEYEGKAMLSQSPRPHLARQATPSAKIAKAPKEDRNHMVAGMSSMKSCANQS